MVFTHVEKASVRVVCFQKKNNFFPRSGNFWQLRFLNITGKTLPIGVKKIFKNGGLQGFGHSGFLVNLMNHRKILVPDWPII